MLRLDRFAEHVRAVAAETRDLLLEPLHGSPHQVGVSDLLDGARWLQRLSSELVLLGVVPQSLELNVGFSMPVQSALGALIASVVAEARELGFEFRRKSDGG